MLRIEGVQMSVVKAIAAAGLAVGGVSWGAPGFVAPRLQQGFAPPAGALANGTSAYDGKLMVPAGLKVSMYAKVPGARFMALGPDGSVYVSQTGAGRVVRLVDANHGGTAAQVVVVAHQQDSPHGLAVHGGYLYIANTDRVVRIKLDGAGVARGPVEPTGARYDAGGGHFTRTIVFADDGTMYVSVGSTCNLCVERDSTRAAVLQFNSDGSGGKIFARGLRNAVGMAIHPVTKQVWVTQNERDNLYPDHENLPPEEINILQAGGDYGWPYCHSDRVPNPEFNDAARCAPTLPPALMMQAHSAPLGMTFLDKATVLPAADRGDALVAFHGSWNRREPTGAKIVRIRIRDGKPVGYEDFITGWQEASGRRWGRPVDVLVARDGSLLISDDDAGLVLRVHK